MKVKECMSNIVNTVKPEATVSDCAKMMCERHIGCVPVCDDEKKVVGILTDRDILLRAVACDKDACNTKVSDIMSTKVFCCDSNSEVEEAEKIMAQEQIRRLPIVEHGKIAGILTLGNLAANDAIPQEDLCSTIEHICDSNFKNAE